MALMMMHTIGLSIIYTELKHARYAYTSTGRGWHVKAGSDSLAFIQGTGLELVLDYYHLAYDADNIRNVFYSMVGDHAKITNGQRHYRTSPRDFDRLSNQLRAEDNYGGEV